MAGIYPSAANTTPGSSIARNKLYDLSATGEFGRATGIVQLVGGAFSYANNLLGDFRVPANSGPVG